MSFLNMVDIVGDEALTNSIIDRSITEIADNLVTKIGENAFYNCSALTKADFSAATNIDSYAFYSCRALTALILRSETMCKLGSSGALNNTPIKSGSGYIYVPRVLVDRYKAASNWKTYANKFRAIEDYPDVCSYKGKAWELLDGSPKYSKTVKHLNGTWLASDLNCLYSSTDGRTWTVVLSSCVMSGAAFSDGLWVVGSSDGSKKGIYTSQDCVQWNAGFTECGRCYAVEYANRIWVAACENGIYYSLDGTSWVQSNITAKCGNSSTFCYSNGHWVVATGYIGKGIYYSSDGMTWTNVEPISSTFAYDVVFEAGVWVAATHSKGVWYSLDGTAWTQSNITSGRYQNICYANGMFVAVGNGWYHRYSTDGKTWTEIPRDELPLYHKSIDYGDGVWVAVSENTSEVHPIYYSEDALNWQPAGIPPVLVYCVCYADGVWIAGSEDGLYYSD